MSKLKSFYWKGVNRFQQKQRGVIVAESAMIAQQQLFAQGLTKLKLQPNWQLSTKPHNAEICDFLVQLAMLLKANLPLKNALQLLLQNCTNVQLNHWLRHLIQSIESGLSFSQALALSPKFLLHQDRQLIQVGEMTGRLAEICQQLAQHKKHSLALQRKVQKILFYPLIVLCVSFVLTILLLLFVVPQFAQMYENNAAQLPMITQVLLWGSLLLQQYAVHFILLLVLIIWWLKRQLQSSVFVRRLQEKLLTFLPVFGRIRALSRLVNFCYSLQLMLRSGVPLQQALQSFLPQKQSWQIKHKWQGDMVLQQEVERIVQSIQQGYAFSQSVSNAIFPMQAQQMLQIGEKSGQLGMILLQIAENYQQRLDHQIDLLSQLLEPFLMLIVGSLIGLIMLGMYLPIFNMGNILQ